MRRSLAILVVTLAWACSAQAQSQSTPADLGARIDQARAAAIKFLRSQIGKDGAAVGEAKPTDTQFGGKTAMCVYALLSAGIGPAQEDVQRAIGWLAQAKLTGTYAVAARACALSMLRGDQHLKLLRGDADWLIKAAASNGSYTYTSMGGKPANEYDNSNAHFAALGVWSAQRRGVEVPEQYWLMIEKFWNEQQQPDGGWGYFARPEGVGTKTYGSMTAAGLASLLVCFDRLRRDQFVRCQATAEPKPITDSLAWLAKNFRADENPRLGANRMCYWLFALGRVGEASGYKYLGRHNWYALGAGELLKMQNADGSFDYGDERAAQTALALLFLSTGSEPVMMNKLSYEGKWNARPRDLASLSLYMWQNFERPVRWQTVDITAGLDDWHDAPILYISGAGAVEFSDQQVQKFRTFVLQGGVILSESACSSADFTLDMQRLYKRMFPQYDLVRLPDDDPIYSIHYRRAPTGLMVLSNGVRPLAIHSPKELSLSLQLGPSEANREAFELAANIVLYLTDKGDFRRGGYAWRQAPYFKPRATIKLARLKFAGNYDPEPLVWQRLAAQLAPLRVKLESPEPIEITDLSPAKYPVAAMTGAGAFALNDKQKKALADYLARGGKLYVEAVGGSKEFADSVAREVLPLYPQGRRGYLPAAHPIYAGPQKIVRINYHADFAATLADKHQGRLKMVATPDGKDIVIVYSDDDLLAGVLGIGAAGMAGYSPDTAAPLMANVIMNLAGVK